MASTAMISFSAVQGTLLSKVAPSTMHLAACAMSAVWSTTTGGLPAPAPMAFLPELSTVVTMPGPPVATSIFTPGCAIILLVFSIDGSATVTIRLSGAPTSCSARFSVWTCHSVKLLARGCGLNTTALPAASMPIALQVTVSVGFVVGVMAPMTP